MRDEFDLIVKHVMAWGEKHGPVYFLDSEVVDTSYNQVKLISDGLTVKRSIFSESNNLIYSTGNPGILFDLYVKILKKPI
jgi:hypothetical protein